MTWLLLSLGCSVERAEPILIQAASPLLSIDRSIDRTAWEGTVRERLDAGSYSYLLVNDRWTVGLDKGAEVGERVRIRPIGRATNFESRRLNRTFEQLDFGIVEHLP